MLRAVKIHGVTHVHAAVVIDTRMSDFPTAFALCSTAGVFIGHDGNFEVVDAALVDCSDCIREINDFKLGLSSGDEKERRCANSKT